jgi:hypothetical protein
MQGNNLQELTNSDYDTTTLETTKQSPMEDALAYMSNQIDDLSRTVEALESRLEQVMTPTPVKDTPQEARTNNGLVGQIQLKGDSILVIKHKVQYILDSLEI